MNLILVGVLLVVTSIFHLVNADLTHSAYQDGKLVLNDFQNLSSTIVASGSLINPAPVANMVYVNSTTIAASILSERILFWSISPSFILLRDLSTPHTMTISALCVINGTYLVSGADDKKAIVWDLRTMSVIRTYLGHGSEVNEIILLSDGDRVASASSDMTVKIWFWGNATLYRSISAGRAVTCVVQVDSDTVVMGVSSYLYFYKISTGLKVNQISITGEPVVMRLYPPNYIIFGGKSGYLNLISTASMTQVYSSNQFGSGSVNKIAISSNGQIFAISGGTVRMLKQFNISSNTLINTKTIMHSSTTYGQNILAVAPMIFNESLTMMPTTTPGSLTTVTTTAGSTSTTTTQSIVGLTLNATIISCYPTPSSPFTITRSSNYQLSGSYSFSYSVSHTIAYKWTIYAVDAVTYQRTSTIAISSQVNPTILTNKFTVTSNTLSYGLYEIVFGVNASISSNIMNSQQSTYLRVVPTGITVMASGNGVATVKIGRNQSYVLDPVSYSVDSDGLASMSSLTFKFYCHRVSNASLLTNYVQLDSSNIDLATSVSTNDCFDSSSDYYFDQPSNNTLVINKGGFLYSLGMINQFVISTVYYGVTYFQIFVIQIEPLIPEVPLLSISCYVSSFCSPYASVKIYSPSNNIILDGSYTQLSSYYDGVSFDWKVFKNTGSIGTPTWTALSAIQHALLNGTTAVEMTIPSYVFDTTIPQYKVEFSLTTLSATYIELNGLNYSTTMVLQTNQVPLNGTCWVDLDYGLAMYTYFTITCKYWYDLDGIVTKYEFFATLANNQSAVNLGNNATGSFYTQLPSGDSTDSYNLYIFVQVFDNSGGITPFYITLPVVVELEPFYIEVEGENIISLSSSSDMVEKLTSSDISVASSAIIAFSSSLNQALADTSSSLSTDQVKQISQVFVDSIAHYDLTGLSSIKAASSALSVVSADPTLITSNTANQIVQLCSEMTDNLVTSAKEFSLTYIYQAASYIVDASANSIQSLNIQSKDSSTLRSAAAKQMSLIETISRITAAQLPINGSQNVNKNNVNLTITRTTMNNALTNVLTDGCTMQFTNPCAVVGQQPGNCSETVITQQTFSRTYALNLNSQVEVEASKSISTSFFTPNMNEYKVTGFSDGFYFWISKSSPVSVSFEAVNIANLTINSTSQLQTYLVQLTTPSQAVTVEIAPSDTTTIGYLIALRYGKVPVIGPSEQSFTVLKVYCPSNLQTEGGNTFYKLFMNMAANTNRDTFVGYGFRQLTTQEYIDYCSSSPSTPTTLATGPVLDSTYNFTSLVSSSVSKYVYASGCYYVDPVSITYSSSGVEVLPDSNTTHTHCVSYHLTEFAGGFIVLPDAIDFGNVWANASFTQNLTIYLTVIIISSLYLILLVWCRYMDWQDSRKRAIFFLEDNSPFDLYFYELIVFTGGRKDAGTDSKVSFILGGSENETGTRKLKPKDCKHKVLQRGSVNSFLMSVANCLGTLNYLRIWHDNSGRNSAASWFLKFIIVHDLQTRDKFYFICNDWLAVEKSDGQVDRVLPVATNKQKSDLSYLMEKQTKEKLSDGHLWFSIIARPPESSFSRTDRLTCAFVLLCLTMLLNIMYYESASSSSSNQLELGPLSLSQTQIVIGVITNLIIFPPSFILLQIFRKSRRRTTRTMKIRKDIEKIVNERTSNPEWIKPNNKKTKKQFTLPWWFKIFGYLMSACIIGVCIFFIIVKGITFGDSLCRKWLTSFLISVLTSICLTQPIQVILLSIFFVLLFRKTNDAKDVEVDPADDGRPINRLKFEKLTEKENEEAFTLAMLETHNAIILQELKRKKEMENKAWKILRKLFFYAIFLTVMFQVAYSKTSSDSFRYQTQLQSLLLQNITKVKTTEDVWNWLSNQFLDPMMATKWYNQESSSLTGYIKDYSSLLVGTVLLRQSRVKSAQCSSRITKRSVCTPDYVASNYEKGSYDLAWKTLSSSSSYTNIEKAFQFTTATSIDSQPYAGLYTNYLGGGYVFKLNTKSSSISSIQSDLDDLQTNSWIDQNSRALFVEFTLYNVNLNLFSYCLILFEFLPTGSVVYTFEFNPMNLYSDESVVIVAFDILYMFLVVFFMLKEIQLMIKLKKAYLKHWWSYVDWCLIAFSWTVFVMYLYRLYEKWRLTSKISSSNDGQTVINFQTMQYWNSLMLMFMAACCFIGSVKLLKVCSFSRNITMLIEVFKRVFKELFAFMVIFIVLILAFTQMMYLMVYDRNQQFQSFATSLVTGFLMMVGKFNVDSFCQDAKVIGPIVYSFYAVAIIMVLLNMFITLLSDSFSEIRGEHRELNELEQDSLLVMYFKSRILPSFKAAFNSLTRRKINYYDSNEPLKYKEPVKSFETKTAQLVNRIGLNYIVKKQ